MSAHVATHMVGLPNHRPPQSPTDYLSHTWDDHMALDSPSSGAPNEHKSLPDASLTNGDHAQNDHDRQNIIGGLLAALAPTSSNEHTEPSMPTDADIKPSEEITAPEQTDVTGLQDDQQITNGNAQPDTHHTRLPSLNMEDANDAFPMMDTSEQIIEQRTTPNGQDQSLSLYDTRDRFPTDIIDEQISPMNAKRSYDAYARLEFADGIFYLNAFRCELGRDQHAFRNALIREKEAKEAALNIQTKPHSSSGRASHRSDGVKQGESQVQGSVVSEAGGFAGVDEGPIEGYDDKKRSQEQHSHPSQVSESSGVHPAEVLHNPNLAPFDYTANAQMQELPIEHDRDGILDDEQPAPVTSEHMPKTDSCPLIPIHTTMGSEQSEVESLRAISRRHVRIYWHWSQEKFHLQVLGRNGAFVDGEWYGKGQDVPLYSGVKIQISAVEFTFRLPIAKSESVIDPDEMQEDELDADGLRQTPTEDDANLTPTRSRQKITLRLNAGGSNANASSSLGADGQPKRRGPGRPPKNGVMSQREMKELQKRQKDDEAKAANGGRTPPPDHTRKPSKGQLPAMEIPAEIPKTEKRKYTKRKREGEEGDDTVIQSIEGEDKAVVAEPLPPPPPPAKKAKSKSLSPEYPARSQLSAEALVRPNQNYAQLLYHILEDGPAPLKDIYRRMKLRWPFFVHIVDSDGWQSSVRHNLNQEVGKLFRKGPKEGKGYHWERIEGAIDVYNANKTKRSTAVPQPQRPRPAPQRPQFPPGQGQQLMWQNTGPYPQQTNGSNTFINQTPYPQQGVRTQNAVNGQAGNGQSPAAANVSRPAAAGPAGQTSNGTNVAGRANTQTAAPGSSAVALLSTTVPCSVDGLSMIKRFEDSFFQQIGKNEQAIAQWKPIFGSAKARLLHGAAQSTLSGGENSEERLIMKHIAEFIEKYKNLNFRGFRSAATTQSATSSSDNVQTATQPTSNKGLMSPPAITSTNNNVSRQAVNSAAPTSHNNAQQPNGHSEAKLSAFQA